MIIKKYSLDYIDFPLCDMQAPVDVSVRGDTTLQCHCSCCVSRGHSLAVLFSGTDATVTLLRHCCHL